MNNEIRKKILGKMLGKAIAFAANQHQVICKQVDKCGMPFFTHPMRVFSMVAARYDALGPQIVAILHDVVEDCSVTFEDVVHAVGLDEELLNALIAITKRDNPDESYTDYMYRVRANLIATIVKVADLRDNHDILRSVDYFDTEKLAKLHEKYRWAIRFLAHKPGTNEASLLRRIDSL